MDFLDELFAPLADVIGVGLTNVLIALLILGIGYVIAKVVEVIVAAILRRTSLDERLARAMGSDAAEPSVEQATARLIFYILMLFVLIAFFQRLNLTYLTDPLNQLLRDIVAFIPNLIAAAIILFVGYLLARVLRGLVTNIAAGLGAERLARRLGLTISLSKLIGTVVYALILIPAIIAALNALDIEAISGPATAMLGTLLDAIPGIFGAALLLAVTYFVGRVVADIVADLLAGLGFDGFVQRLGFYDESTSVTGRTPSQVVGFFLLVAIMLFAAMEAANLLGFEILAALLAEVIAFGGRLLLALVIFALGLYLANLAREVVLNSGSRNAELLSQLARWAILIFSGAIALRHLGVADEIINLAFGLLLGAIAVAAALAFGLGGREIAERETERLLQRMRSTPPPAPTPPTPPPTGDEI